MGTLQDSIDAVRDGSSLYWAFYDPSTGKKDRTLIEVRLDAAPGQAANFSPSIGWVVHRVQSGDTIFLRRLQSLERKAVEEMLVEILVLADIDGMQFHSWLSGSDLD